ncbi:MAG TPA: hypothetical protein VM695_15400, partial [Phycisphaerae bacterium]|nr:hypothetical protein [Phycisphaerae bacterium]
VTYLGAFVAGGLLAASCALAAGPSATPRADRVLAPHGLGQFPEYYRQALEAFLTAEDLYQRGDHKGCLAVLEALWAKYPPGREPWVRIRDSIAGVNVGSPPCYYALRMLTDCARWRLKQGKEAPRGTATLTVVLVGRSKGVEPTSRDELEKGTGREVEHALDPLLLKDDHRVVRQSLWLFCEFASAMTDGRLAVQTRFRDLPDLCVPVQAVLRGRGFANLARGAMDSIWTAVGEPVQTATDWWWVLYPSHVPEQYPDFKTTEFVTGGMASGPDGASPCFLIDDRWLVRKPPHLGQGPYSDEERRAYLPQWLYHEFAHHLFREYPEFGLEAKGHQWFDLSTWPKDFQGRWEPDYFQEALHKRLKPKADPPLHVKLRYAPPPKELFRRIALKDLCGAYRHEPVENDWHVGTIQPEPAAGKDTTPALRWRNKAGMSWRLTPDLAEGVLRTGEENPYYDSNPTHGRAFRIVLRRNADGEYAPEVAGFLFQGGFFAKQAK